MKEFGDSGAELIGDMLKVNSTFKSLNLSRDAFIVFFMFDVDYIELCKM